MGKKDLVVDTWDVKRCIVLRRFLRNIVKYSGVCNAHIVLGNTTTMYGFSSNHFGH